MKTWIFIILAGTFGSAVIFGVGQMRGGYLARQNAAALNVPIVEPCLLPNMDDELAEPTAAWNKRYGMWNDSKLYYNVVMQRAVLNQHAQVINNLRSTTQPTSQPVEKP